MLCSFLSGCATVPRAASMNAVTINGTRYVQVESLKRSYNLAVEWDPVAQKVILSKDDQEARFMAGSSAALLNNTLQSMEQPARVYRGSLAIPASFSRKKMAAFFKQQYVPAKFIKTAELLIKTVIIDAGHGGKDPGAVGRSGLKEKNLIP